MTLSIDSPIRKSILDIKLINSSLMHFTENTSHHSYQDAERQSTPRTPTETLLSIVHFHTAKGHEPGSSPLAMQSRPRGFYLGVCNGLARALLHGRHEGIV